VSAARSAVVCLLLTFVTACSTPAPNVPSSELRALIANGAVVAADEPPEIEFEGFAHGKLEGMGIGAASTFVACAGGLGGGSCEGAVCGAVVILWLGVCTVSSTVGGVVGAVVAPSAKSVRTSEEVLRGALEANPMQSSLRDEVLASARAAGRDLGPASPERAGASLEVALTRVGTEGSGVDPPLLVFMNARARIVRASDGAELFAADYRYEGERRTLREWSAERGAPLLHALETGYATLGAQIFDGVFRLYPFPDRDVHTSGLLGTAFGLAPLDPTTRGQLSDDLWLGSWLEWQEVEDRRPTLRWQSFPRATDSNAAPAEMGRVTNVRYDLLIAREKDGTPAEIVYRREGLPAPRHRLEKPLEAATRYFWTVRARFELDGRTQLTEWSGTGAETADRLGAPSRRSFRFRTR